MSAHRRPAARVLAQFVSQLSPASLPREVIDRVTFLLFDHVGVTVGGSRTDSAVRVRRALADLGSGGAAIVLGHGSGASPAAAAIANGTAAHSLEMDDTHNGGSIHLGTTMFPAALACAALVPTSGGAFLTAAVAGYEVAARIAMALGPKAHYDRGFHPTGTCGAFGAAAVAARLLGLDEQGTTWALGIAGSQAAGSLEFLADGAWTKRLHPGWAAAAGLHAATFARHGFQGPPTVFEGRYGFLAAHSAEPRTEPLTAGLGSEFETLRTSVKPHACCRYKQAPIDALVELRRAHAIRPDEVESVTIGVLDAGFPIVCEPREKKLMPASVVDAQFSLPFGAAVALLFGRASPREYCEAHLRDPTVLELMRRVHGVRDEALEADYPRQWPAWVRVRLRDGREHMRRVSHPHGDPENPLSWADLEAKVQGLLPGAATPESVRTLHAAVTGLDRAPDLQTLFAALRAFSPQQ